MAAGLRVESWAKRNMLLGRKEQTSAGTLLPFSVFFESGRSSYFGVLARKNTYRHDVTLGGRYYRHCVNYETKH